MIGKPPYFETIRARAASRWKQLKQDPELAGPWHQLFKQVQSPRHVVSELLQNADDAGATEAAVEIRDGEFVFSHNGEDFTEEHFASLCRFGYSNKRALHTIGFRGIGFKSTFSLGDEVRLITPTLAVRFHRERFTEPIWCDGAAAPRARTSVFVTIKDEHRRVELTKNLDEWLRSPASLLFFRHLRSLRVGDKKVEWTSQGAGPVAGSNWMALSFRQETRYLLIRSPSEEFPGEALEEIRQERMISVDESSTFPPCQIEIVLGLEGRLYVVLPTGVRTELPFACNAPFVQDPARVKIKNPEISPTNRWLLRRAGELAAEAMLAWLEDRDVPVRDRTTAYDLLTNVDRDDESLEGSCATIVETAFGERVEDAEFLLTNSGTLTAVGDCIAVPPPLLEVWEDQQITMLLPQQAQETLTRHVSPGNRQKLLDWGFVDELTDTEVLSAILKIQLPLPRSWRQLLALWVYLREYLPSPWQGENFLLGANIVPVQGMDVLGAAEDVVRLGDRKLLQSDDDWSFLSDHLSILHKAWPQFLAEQKRKAEKQRDEQLANDVEQAYRVLKVIGLAEPSDATRVIHQVAEEFFGQDELGHYDCIRLAQVAAALDAAVSGDFYYITRDGDPRRASSGIVCDEHGDLDLLVEEKWWKKHVLHEDYLVFKSCTRSQWKKWISSGSSGLSTFLPLSRKRSVFRGRSNLQDVLKERGFVGKPYYHYKTESFALDDWDFGPDLWRRWRALAKDDLEIWGRLLTRILEQTPNYWTKSVSASIAQIGTTGNERLVTSEPLCSAWILTFRSLACLEDTRGNYRVPSELLRRTPETESLLDVEAFVRGEFDTEANRPLLEKLGVRETATGPERLLDRLRALATVNAPPVYEVEKWYNRLDQLALRCATAELEEMRRAFQDEKLILTEESTWGRAGEVFLGSDEEDVPGAALIHRGVRHLSLWPRVGVASRPTAELALNWLKSLESGQALPTDEARRVRSLLPRYPDRIWSECGHWLNLEGEWIPTHELKYSLTMQTLVGWKHLFRPYKRTTADLQKLPVDVSERPPFSTLPSLAQRIEERFEEEGCELSASRTVVWLNALGGGLARVVLDDPVATHRVQELGARLARTKWQVASGLATTPYIDGAPAGTPRQVDVLWKDLVLYVEGRSAARMAKAVAQELGRVFDRQEIADAIKLCYERSGRFVQEFLDENFELTDEELCTSPVARVRAGREDEGQIGSDDSRASWMLDEGEEDEDSPVAEDLAIDGEDEASEEDTDTQHTEWPEVDEEDEIEATPGLDEPARVPRTPPRPARTSLMERFAKAMGYARNGDHRFVHPDGSRIEKAAGGDSFPWHRYSVSGALVRCYWDKDHCLYQAPLQLDAEVWRLCDQHPDKYALVLVDADECPWEITGRQLREMCDRRELTLYPATYRLVHESAGSSGQPSARAATTGILEAEAG